MEQSPSSVLPVTVPQPHNSNSDQAAVVPRKKRTLVVWYVLGAVVLVALVVVGAGVAFAVLRKTSNKDKAVKTTQRQQEISDMIRSIADPAKLAIISSPQAEAHAWLTRHDNIWADESIALTMEMVTQRYALAVVYFATNGSSSWVTPNGWLQGHECQWLGVTCNNLEQVHTLVLGT
jgi:heme/copper-type cytochrome/quinol oxidase subunit 2